MGIEIVWPLSDNDIDPEFYTYHSDLECGGSCSVRYPHVHLGMQWGGVVWTRVFSNNEWRSIMKSELSNTMKTDIPKFLKELE